jgi:hypothetical protein
MQYTYKYKHLLYFFMIILNIFCSISMAQTQPLDNSLKNNNIYIQKPSLYDQYPWAVTYYYGITVAEGLSQIASGQIRRWPEHIQTVELSHTLAPQNIIRRFVSPLVGIVQFAGNMTIRNGSREPTIYEFNPYLVFRWANFPWNDYVNTSLAIGEGISYVSSIPTLEKKSNSNTKRLLNYLLLEATFAIPKYPRWQLALRIHHRSGAYGLYHAGNTGSNNIGLGIRYLFD